MAKEKIVNPPKKKFNKSYIRRYYQLYLLLLLPILYLIIFKYLPMWYVLIAFKKYSIVKPILQMPWAKNNGFEYFIKALKLKTLSFH